MGEFDVSSIAIVCWVNVNYRRLGVSPASACVYVSFEISLSKAVGSRTLVASEGSLRLTPAGIGERITSRRGLINAAPALNQLFAQARNRDSMVAAEVITLAAVGDRSNQNRFPRSIVVLRVRLGCRAVAGIARQRYQIKHGG